MDRFDELRKKILPVLAPYVQWVAVFGSYARGEETPESDVDILVELKPPGERPPLGLKWFGLERELSRVLGREVEFGQRKRAKPLRSPLRGKRDGAPV